jgi:cytochrome d ubiquinol oxidase subunit II
VRRATARGWQRFWFSATRRRELLAPFLWGVALTNLLNGVPLSSTATTRQFSPICFSLYTVFSGLAIVALFAFHGATS